MQIKVLDIALHSFHHIRRLLRLFLVRWHEFLKKNISSACKTMKICKCLPEVSASPTLMLKLVFLGKCISNINNDNIN